MSRHLHFNPAQTNLLQAQPRPANPMTAALSLGSSRLDLLPLLRHLPYPHISAPASLTTNVRCRKTLHVTNFSRVSPANQLPENCVHHPSLEILGGAREKYLPHLRNLDRPYEPFPVIGWNRHVETIFAAFCRSLPDVRYRRECIRTEDGGVVALDWVAGDDSKLPANAPIVILLPGLTGGSHDTYVRHVLVRARNHGWRVVVFNSRGCGNSPVTTAKFYSSSYTGDLRQVVAHVGGLYLEANLYTLGWSIGANIMVRYLGEESHKCPLAGAVSLCNPFNLPIADEDFRKGFNNIYDKSLTNSLRRILKKHTLLFEDIGGEYNIPLSLNAKTVKEFDEGLTRVSFGWKSADDYYINSSSSDSIKDVCIPLLCIQAANDPIAPERGIPRNDIEDNEHCLLIVTPKGGHLGWVAGAEAPLGAPWTDPFVIDFLEYLEKRSTKALSSTQANIKSRQHADNLQHVEV